MLASVYESEPTFAERLRGVPLTIILAESEAIESAARVGTGEIPLAAPFHVSDDDAYLVVPEDIGVELAEMFRDGDLDLLEDALRESIVALGSIERDSRRSHRLVLSECISPKALLRELDWREIVGVSTELQTIPMLNKMFRYTVASSFVDAEGLSQILEHPEYAGISWRGPNGKDDVDPTYVWSKKMPDGRSSVECALFAEYEELVMLLRPVLLAPLDL